MQYLVSVISDSTEVDAPEVGIAIDVFNDRLRAQGYWVYGNGLAAPSAATVVDNRGDAPVFSDGPFLESKEHLAGFWILEATDLDVVLPLAAEASKACNRRIEVRPMAGDPA